MKKNNWMFLELELMYILIDLYDNKLINLYNG